MDFPELIRSTSARKGKNSFIRAGKEKIKRDASALRQTRGLPGRTLLNVFIASCEDEDVGINQKSEFAGSNGVLEENSVSLPREYESRDVVEIVARPRRLYFLDVAVSVITRLLINRYCNVRTRAHGHDAFHRV